MDNINNILENVKCPICNNDDFEILEKNKYSNYSIEEIKKIYLSSSDYKIIDQIVKCNKCTLIYLNPRINSNIILKSYQNNPDENFFSQNQNRYLTFKRSFLKIKKKINFESLNVLDIGSGDGSFLRVLKEQKINYLGIEPNQWLVNKSKLEFDLNIVQGTIEKLPSEKKFDVITLWDVLEHLTDLNFSMLEIKKIINKDGYLIINVPDQDSLARKILRSKWPFYLNVHLYYFNEKTLSLLLKNYNFKLINKTAHWQTLELGYIVNRASKYFKILKFIEKIISFLKIKNVPIKYNMGQTQFIFKNENQ
tara:strand:- start:1119 stop:2042 length:924 start_codon:yes stop_codon:yes gene_type:complete